MALSKITNASVADTAVHGRRNMIINGSTNVWQKGTSVGGVSNGVTGMDRFFSHGGCTASRQSFTVGQTDVPHEPEFYCRHTSTGTANGFHTKIENVRSGAGQTVTFSFWAKANKSTTVDALFRQRFGSGGSSTNFDDQNSQFTLTTSWQKFETQKTLDSISGKTIGAGNFLEVGIYHNSGAANDYIEFAQVQLEVGDTATPFEHRSYGEELALCQRYYIKSGNVGTDTEWFAGVATYAGYGGSFAQCIDGNQDRVVSHVKFPVYMRARPTVTYYPARSDTANTSNRLVKYNGTTLTTPTYYPSSDCNGLFGYFSGLSYDYVAFSFQFTADAEL